MSAIDMILSIESIKYTFYKLSFPHYSSTIYFIQSNLIKWLAIPKVYSRN